VLRRLTIPPIQYSILHKVLNAVAALDPTKVPQDSEFNFRGRAGVLYGRFQAAIDAGNVSEPSYMTHSFSVFANIFYLDP
jgi:hypothetical protein